MKRYTEVMPSNESSENKLVRVETKLDGLIEKVGVIDSNLRDNYVTEDKLALKLAPIELMRKIIIWLVVIIATETFGLIFYAVQRLIFRNS